MNLGDIAYARSGDKGANANVGVAARRAAYYPALLRFLSAQRVKEYFADVCDGPVDRYEMPNIYAVNFVLHEVLDGGATRSLRLDPQGKTLCDSLMALALDPSTEEAIASLAETDNVSASSGSVPGSDGR